MNISHVFLFDVFADRPARLELLETVAATEASTSRRLHPRSFHAGPTQLTRFLLRYSKRFSAVLTIGIRVKFVFFVKWEVVIDLVGDVNRAKRAVLPLERLSQNLKFRLLGRNIFVLNVKNVERHFELEDRGVVRDRWEPRLLCVPVFVLWLDDRNVFVDLNAKFGDSVEDWIALDAGERWALAVLAVERDYILKDRVKRRALFTWNTFSITILIKLFFSAIIAFFLNDVHLKALLRVEQGKKGKKGR